MQNPIVKFILTIVGLVLAGAAAIPQCAAYAPVLSPVGSFILGALHVPRPGDVKAAP